MAGLCQDYGNEICSKMVSSSRVAIYMDAGAGPVSFGSHNPCILFTSWGVINFGISVRKTQFKLRVWISLKYITY